MTTDLTKGSPLKLILIFAFPFALLQVATILYGIVHAIIVRSALGFDAYTAISTTGMPVYLTETALSMMCAGFSVILAKHFGANDEEKVKQTFASSIKFAVFFSVIFTPVCVILARPMLVLLHTPEDILDRAHSYLLVIFVGLIVSVIGNLLSFTVRALGNSKIPLYTQIIILACVLVFDYIFTSVFNMGLAGVGVGVILGRLIGTIPCVLYIRRNKILHLSKRHFKASKALDLTLLKTGLTFAVQTVFLGIGGVAAHYSSNGLGTFYLSAGAATSNLISLVIFPSSALGTAISVFSAQNYGAGKYSRVIVGYKKALLVSLSWWAASSAIIIPFGKLLIKLVAGSDVSQSLVDNAYISLLINVVFSFTSVMVAILYEMLNGSGLTTFATVGSFTEVIGRVVVAVLVIYLGSVFGPLVAFVLSCFSQTAANVGRLIPMFVGYIRMTRNVKKLPDTEKLENVTNV